MDKFHSIPVLALALVLVSSIASAAPAAATMQASGIDANTFIVGHPASPRWKPAHSNGEHPAVIVSARAGAASPDSNRFIVQPPASVRWTRQPLPIVLAGVPR